MTGSLEEGFSPQSVTFRLAHDIDISRFDMIFPADQKPNIGQKIDVMGG